MACVQRPPLADGVGIRERSFAGPVSAERIGEDLRGRSLAAMNAAEAKPAAAQKSVERVTDLPTTGRPAK